MLTPGNTIDVGTFERQVIDLFAYLSDAFETTFASLFDEIDCTPSALKIILAIEFCQTAQRGTFLLSRHTPTRQLWYASPVSGATHFALKEGIWTSTQSANVLLPQLLGEELSLLTGQGVPLTYVS